MTIYEKGFYTIVAFALVQTLIALPLAMRRVPRNVVYGFRTRRTLHDDEAWFETNEHFGRGLLVASLIALVGAFILDRYRPFPPETYLPVSLAVLVVPSLFAMVATAWSMRSSRGQDGGRS